MSFQNNNSEESPQQFAERIGLEFKDYLLLSRALTHRSYLNEHPEALEDNERLEFLGDAVLDFLVGAWLYNHFPEMREGDLTRFRSALVRTEQLAEFAGEINLGDAIKLGKGEGEGGGRKRQALLCGTFEALVGAIFLDSGFEHVMEFMEPKLNTAAENILSTRTDLDPKSLLQEWVQSQGYGPPDYHTVSESGPDHDKTFEINVLVNGELLGKGSGPSKQSAAKAAARSAMKNLGIT